jgi:TonB family protein
MKAQLVLCLLLASVAPAVAQSTAPRDTPPPAIENARRERELRAAAAAGTATKAMYLELARLANQAGRFDDTIAALRGAAALEPGTAEPQHQIAVFYWDHIRSNDGKLDAESRLALIREGIAAEDLALAARPDYLEAMTYKNILLRMQANLTADPLEQQRLIAEADSLRNRVIDMQRQRTGTPQAAAGAPAPPAPPPPPFVGFPEAFEQTVARLQPIRVGGNVRTPTKIKDVRPADPPVAQQARVQGVVIIEAIIDDRGEIANARVLRSIPLLDDAALSAVSQWQFTPTLLNGAPVGVIMTVTVNFTLTE